MSDEKFNIFDEGKMLRKEIEDEASLETEKRTAFGLKLRSIREENGFKQADLADVLKRTHDVISNYERGLRYPYKQELDKICDLFNVKLEYFFPDHKYPKLRDLSNMKKYSKKGQRRNSPVVVRRAEDLGINVGQPKKMYSTSTRTTCPEELSINYDVEDEVNGLEDIYSEAAVDVMEPDRTAPNEKNTPDVEIIQSNPSDSIKRKITIVIGKEITVNVEEY